MSVVTKNGTVLTDEMIEKLAEQWENDSWSGHLDKVIMGRPRISDEELVNVTFRMPKSYLASIERITKESGQTRSTFLRNAVERALIL